MKISRASLLLSLGLVLIPNVSAIAQKDADWTGTWTAAAMGQKAESTHLPLGSEDVTLRQVVHISQGGKQLRVTFTNEFGTTPLHISAAHVAFLSAGSNILPQTDKALTFSGKADVVIPPGQFIASDAVKETVPIFSDLVITTAIPQQEMPTYTYHALGLTTSWFAPGNDVSATEIATPPTTSPVNQQAASDSTGGVVVSKSWYFLKNVEVNRERKSAAIVTLGDSITDGAASTPNTNRRWPDQLAPLLAAQKKTKHLAILNAGISGNRILHFGAGPSALDRFNRDVLLQPGAKYVVMLEGINDIGNMHRTAEDAITEQQLLDAYTTLANKVHSTGLKFIVATMTPYQGAKYYSEDGEQIREHVNQFLRTSKLFDGVIDFDKITSDPEHPLMFLPKYDSGDHLHPSDAGYTAMAAGINLKLFR